MLNKEIRGEVKRRVIEELQEVWNELNIKFGIKSEGDLLYLREILNDLSSLKATIEVMEYFDDKEGE